MITKTCETKERLSRNNAERLVGEIQDFLRSQGVTTKEGLRAHSEIIVGTLRANPSFDLSSYRISKDTPETPVMG